MSDLEQPTEDADEEVGEGQVDELGEDAIDSETTRPPAENTLGVVLAAGAGSRFTEANHKLLAKLEKKPLVWWATRHALDAGFAEVLVIEGCIELADSIPKEASLAHNDDWADGQARTLQVAVHYAEMMAYEAVVVGLGDQPYVPPEAWRRVAASSSPIATARFGKQTAPPVRLHGDVWGLLPLDGDEGARRLLRSRPEMVAEVACPGSSFDVDTVSELDRIRRDPLKRSLGQWT